MDMARLDLAAVDPDIESLVQKSVGGSIYGKLRPPDCDYGDLHPDTGSSDCWTASPTATESILSMTCPASRGPCPMNIRNEEPTFHLFLKERSVTEFVVEFGPLVRDPRTDEIMPGLFDRSKLGPVVNCIMWRLTWQFMMGPRLDLDEALPEGIYGRAAGERPSTPKTIWPSRSSKPFPL
jgi:hypothetical protein